MAINLLKLEKRRNKKLPSAGGEVERPVMAKKTNRLTTQNLEPSQNHKHNKNLTKRHGGYCETKSEKKYPDNFLQDLTTSFFVVVKLVCYLELLLQSE